MIEKIEFGNTGHLSTRCIFGGTALSSVDQDTADQTLELLMKYDINHIDTAAGYGDSELRIGPWMRKHRKNFFLATKTSKRTESEARKELEKSLKRLEVDHVDLIQMHMITEPDEWNIAMSPGGALEALIKAKEEGIVNNIGVTGHGVTVARRHIQSLEKYNFDSVLLPLNYTMVENNPDYAKDFNELRALCKKRKVAFQTIKAIARRRWTDEDKHQTWYEPLEKQKDIDTTVHWVLNHEEVFLNTAGNVKLLPLILIAANNFNKENKSNLIETTIEDADMKPLFTAEQNLI